jgi:hypothetical protein
MVSLPELPRETVSVLGEEESVIVPLPELIAATVTVMPLLEGA